MQNTNKLRGLGPRTNYTDRATAACKFIFTFFFKIEHAYYILYLTQILVILSTVIIICSTYFNVTILHFAHRGYLRIMQEHENKQGQFPQTAFGGWSL
jgi:hypothetical protein